MTDTSLGYFIELSLHVKIKYVKFEEEILIKYVSM